MSAIQFFPHTTNADTLCDLGGGVSNRDLGVDAGAGNVTVSTSFTSVGIMAVFDKEVSAYDLRDSTWTYSMMFSIVAANGEFFFQIQAIDAACAVVFATGAVPVNAGQGLYTGTFSPFGWPDGAVRLRLVVEGRSLDSNPASIRVTCGPTSWIKTENVVRKTRLETIAEALLTRLSAIQGDAAGYNYVIGTTGIAKRPPSQIDKLPAAFIGGMSATRETMTSGSVSDKKNEALGSFVFALCAADDDKDEQLRLFMRDVVRALEAMPTNLSLSYVLDAIVTEFVPDVSESEITKPYSMGFLTVEARYRMGRGII